MAYIDPKYNCTVVNTKSIEMHKCCIVTVVWMPIRFDGAIVVGGVRCIYRAVIIEIHIFEGKCTPYGSLSGSLAHVVGLFSSVPVHNCIHPYRAENWFRFRVGSDCRKLFPGGTLLRTDSCVLDNVLSTYEYRQIVAQSRCVTIIEDTSSIAATCMRTRSIVIGSISTSTARDPCEIEVFAGSA